jgi:hypothetical protein
MGSADDGPIVKDRSRPQVREHRPVVDARKMGPLDVLARQVWSLYFRASVDSAGMNVVTARADRIGAATAPDESRAMYRGFPYEPHRHSLRYRAAVLMATALAGRSM